MENTNTIGEQPAKSVPLKKAKRKLKPGMGKAKGNNFEGQVAKKLTAALAPLTFIRSPGSGARVGGKNFATFGKMFGEDAMKLFVGDVVPTNERDTNLSFLWSIECKSYAKSDSFETMVAGNSNVFKWFEESVIDAAKTGKEPILIFKWNHTPIYAATTVITAGCIPVKPRLTLDQGERSLAIFYFDDLISDPSFWAVNTGV
jgi:hypothetical protein